MKCLIPFTERLSNFCTFHWEHLHWVLENACVAESNRPADKYVFRIQKYTVKRKNWYEIYIFVTDLTELHPRLKKKNGCFVDKITLITIVSTLWGNNSQKNCCDNKLIEKWCFSLKKHSSQSYRKPYLAPPPTLSYYTTGLKLPQQKLKVQ